MARNRPLHRLTRWIITGGGWGARNQEPESRHRPKLHNPNRRDEWKLKLRHDRRRRWFWYCPPVYRSTDRGAGQL